MVVAARGATVENSCFKNKKSFFTFVRSWKNFRMDVPGRHVRSRTSSTSSLRSPGPQQQGAVARPLPQASPDNRVRCPSAEQQLSGSSRSSSIPPTPAPTPNPLLHVSMVHEQLVAGIKQLRADEGYVDSTSFPATPAPSPFSPSPAQNAAPSAAQVAEKLRDVSGASTNQPPTPSTTPGAGHAPFPGGHAHQNLGVIPEHLAESIHQRLRCQDEGLDSTSSPGTPVPTPISPCHAHMHQNRLLPEQLAAGIHRLKVEEGMSSGGSSGFPSTPAPTPFSHHPGGVTPEDLAAGISRLSVIEETKEQQSGNQLSQYFEDHQPQNFFDQLGEPEQGSEKPTDTALSVNAKDDKNNKSEAELDVVEHKFSYNQSLKKQKSSETATDNVEDMEKPTDASVLHSCRESHVDLSVSAKEDMKKKLEAELDVVEQKFDDVKSLKRRQSSEHRSRTASEANDNSGDPVVCKIFSDTTQPEAEKSSDPFDTIAISQSSPRRSPSTLDLPEPSSATAESSYSTPVAPTPVNDKMGYSTHLTSTPFPNAPALLTKGTPITSPLPQSAPEAVIPPPPQQELPLDEEEAYDEVSSAWIPSPATAQTLAAMASQSGTFFPERYVLTMPGVQVREDLQDPVRNLVAHYRGESEAAKRQVLTADTVSQDQRGLRQLIRAGCYRAAVNLTSRLLQTFKQGFGQVGTLTRHTPTSLQVSTDSMTIVEWPNFKFKIWPLLLLMGASKDSFYPSTRFFFWLLDDSANDDWAIDKMAARFSHTDNSATFLFEKKMPNFFLTPNGLG